MTEINTGGPAFPVSTRPCETGQGFGHQDSDSTWKFGGMTLRDYFAAKAMQALWTAGDRNVQEVAADAYYIADAMLKEKGE